MNLINQKISSYEQNPAYKTGFKADAVPGFYTLPQQQNIPEITDVELPDIYYMPENYKTPKTFVDTIKKIDLFGLIHPWFEHPLLMIATCAGLSLGVDAFDKSCNKEYSKSIVGKAAKLGDNIENSSLIQSNGSQSILKGIKTGWNKVKTFAMKNDVINSMFTTPSEPEWSTPKDELKNTNYRIVTKFKQLAAEFDMVPGMEAQGDAARRVFKIKNMALDKTEIENLKRIYNVDNISKIPEAEVVNRVMLQRLGKSEEEISKIITQSNASAIVSKEIFKKSGLTTEQLQAIFKDETGETMELVREASKNLRGVKIAHGKFVIPGPRQPFANIEGFEGIYNRAHSLTLNQGAKTKTGKFLSKLVQKIYRGFTFGNQKQAVLLWVTPFMVRSILNTIKADKDEKVGTAVSEFINSFSWVFIFPFVLRSIYAFGGIQYAGMGKEKVDEYKKLINDFNARTNSAGPDGFKTLAEYKAAKGKLKKQLKELRTVKNQNLLTETLRDISRFSKADLLKIESFKGGSATANLLRKLPNTLKDYLIYAPGRFAIFLMVGFPFVSKLVDKCTSKIFGKAYDEFKDTEEISGKNKQKEFTINDLRTRLVNIQKDKLYPPEASEAVAADNTGKIAQHLIPVSMLKLSEQAENDRTESMPEEALTVKDGISKPETEAEIKPDFDLTPSFKEQNANEIFDTQALKKESVPLINDEDIVNITEIEPLEVVEQISEPKEMISEEEIKSEKVSGEEIAQEETLNSEVAPVLQNYDDYTYIPSSENTVPVPKEEAFINKYIPSQENVIPEEDNTEIPIDKYIPSQENKVSAQNSAEQPMDKYIPSQLGIKVNKVFDNSELEKAIRRSQRAEKKALDALAGNFGNI